MNAYVLLRGVGCALALIAHSLLAWGNPLGVWISLIGQFAFLPWSIVNSAWDMVVLDGFYVVINVASLLS